MMDSLDTWVDNIISHAEDPALLPGCPAFNMSTYCQTRRLIKAIVKEVYLQITTKAQIAADTNGDTNPPGSIS